MKIEFLWALSECTSLQLQQLYTAAGLEMPTTNTIGVLIDLCPSTIPVAKMREWIAAAKAGAASTPCSDSGEAADKAGTKPAAAKEPVERPASSTEQQPQGAQSLSDLYSVKLTKRQRTSAARKLARTSSKSRQNSLLWFPAPLMLLSKR